MEGCDLSDVEGCEPSVDLSHLPFEKRWEICGSPPPSAPASAQQIPWRPSITSMEASQRLAGGSPLLGSSKSQQSMRLPVEPGSPMRIFETWPLPSHESGGRCRVDYLAKVASGFEDLRCHEREWDRQRRGKRLSFSESKAPSVTVIGSPVATSPAHLATRGTLFPELGDVTPSSSSPGLLEEGSSAAQSRWLAVAEFAAWCNRQFGSVNLALEVFGAFDNNALVGSEAFLALLTHQGYPPSALSAKRLFTTFDSDGDGLISRHDVVDTIKNVKSEADVGREQWEMIHARAVQHLIDIDVDPVEAHLLTRAAKESDTRTPMAKLQEKLMARLAKREPLMAEFMAYLYTCFKTLKMGFRSMDVNGNGSLSKSEFKDCLLRIRSRDDKRFLEVHLRNTYSKLVVEAGGQLNLHTLLSTPESEDPLIRTLGNFLADTLRRGNEPAHSPIRTRDLEDTFQKAMGGKRALLTFEEFHSGMQRLKYADWLINQLFIRIDSDGSGDITVRELASFLEPDLPPPRPAHFGPPVPLGSVERQMKVMGRQCTTENSMKLQARKGYSHSKLAWEEATAVTNKKDNLLVIKEALRDRRSRRRCPVSELLVRGEHAFRGSPISVKKMLPDTQHCDLHFYEVEARGYF